MKLVDINQTIFIPVVDETHDGVTVEMKMTVGEFFKKFCEGFEPETVEAIPVQWLEQQFYDNPKSQWAEKCRDVYTKWQKWQRWQKEQEAKT